MQKIIFRKCIDGREIRYDFEIEALQGVGCHRYVIDSKGNWSRMVYFRLTFTDYDIFLSQLTGGGWEFTFDVESNEWCNFRIY